MNLLHSHSPFRIFLFSGSLTILAFVAVWYYIGIAAALTVLVLMAIEITFSFENAIINARVLKTMTRVWQLLFMTIGIAIAIFGMRIIFPIVIVMLTSGLGWNEVVSLALNNPEDYALELERAYPSIAAFGGMFLLMLALHFFFDHERRVLWWQGFEQWMQDVGVWWTHAVVSFIVLLGVAFIPGNNHARETIVAGVIGIFTYLIIHGLSEAFSRHHKRSGVALKTGMAGLMSFLYLEVLDASFSFDGVIGAFAVSKDVVLIAAGLGVGALWVRSFTIFMIRRGTLDSYRYLEHGAHYTIALLAFVLLAGIFHDIPEFGAGVMGIGIISAAVYSSIKISRIEDARARR